jgi:hypothetical protein
VAYSYHYIDGGPRFTVTAGSNTLTSQNGAVGDNDHFLCPINLSGSAATPSSFHLEVTFSEPVTNAGVYLAEYTGADPTLLYVYAIEAAENGGNDGVLAPFPVPSAPALLWAFAEDFDGTESTFSAGSGFTARSDGGVWGSGGIIALPEDRVFPLPNDAGATWSVAVSSSFLFGGAVLLPP